jgi:uncharacterized protein (TIGR02594 family)
MNQSTRAFASSLILALGLSACNPIAHNEYTPPQWRTGRVSLPAMSLPEQLIHKATQDLGLNEQQDRAVLRNRMGIDPRRIEWCAAYINTLLRELGQPGTERVTDYPLTAQSFLNVGTPVPKNSIQPGDIVVFRRGNESWQGHVGIFIGVDPQTDNWLILGGNQNNSVSIQTYSPGRRIGIRRLALEQV